MQEGNFKQQDDGDTLLHAEPGKKGLGVLIIELFVRKSPPLYGTHNGENCPGFTGYFPFVYNNSIERRNYYRCPECSALVEDHIVEEYFRTQHLSDIDLNN